MAHIFGCTSDFRSGIDGELFVNHKRVACQVAERDTCVAGRIAGSVTGCRAGQIVN